MKRRLALKSEYLAPLSSDDLSAVAGAGVTTDCLTGMYPSIRVECPTLDGCIVIGGVLSVHRPCPTLEGCLTGTSGYTLLCR